MKKRYLPLKKGDFVVIFISLLLALVIFFIPFQNDNDNEKYVKITLENKEYGVYDINKDIEIKIQTAYGFNYLVIKNKEVYIKDANCSGRDCVISGKISKGGESIVCIPHKIIVLITGTTDIDVII